MEIREETGNGASHPQATAEVVEIRATPRSVVIAQSIADTGVATDRDAARLMAALAVDVVLGKISPGVANASINGTGKLLKIVELRHKYGTVDAHGHPKALPLIEPDDAL